MSSEPTAATASLSLDKHPMSAHALTFRAWIIGSVLFLLLAFAWGTVAAQTQSWNIFPLAVLLLATAVAVHFDIEIGHVSFAGDFVPLVACAVISPELAPLCAIPTLFLSYSCSETRYLSTLSIASAVASASLVVTLLGEPKAFADIVIAVALAGLVFISINVSSVVTFMLALRRATSAEMLPAAAASIVSSAVVLLPLVMLVVWAWAGIGSIALPLIVVPLTVAQYFVSLYHRKVELTNELAEKAQILARTNLQFAAAMVRALDARDAYTAGHSAAVAVYTRDIAREMGFDDEIVRLAHLSGLLHDIGKIGVPGRVLNKTAPLDDEEYELMKSHAAMGADILGEVDLYEEIAIFVRYHHERMDGKGYPDGIAGEAIPAISRMISVADTYSAMTTDRPYREGMPTSKAMSILRDIRSTQLDKDFTDAFLRILVVADEAYQRGKQTDFEVEVAKHQALSEVEAEAIRVAAPVVPATSEDGELVEIELEREAA